MRYKLRTLLILLSVGPPLLAAAWTNRQSLLAPPPPVTPYIPRGATTGKVLAQDVLRRDLHYVTGWAAAVSYPVAVILLVSVVRTMRHWWQPPKRSPLIWAAIAASIVSAGFVLVYFLTFPPPSGYATWSAYFATHGQEKQDIGRQ